MSKIAAGSLGRSLVVAAAAALLAGCADGAPLAPELRLDRLAGAERAEMAHALATLRRATARYHDLNAAIADGFQLLHPCEERPGEGPVGLVYYHPGRLMDGLVDPLTPDALVYDPVESGRPQLIGVEFAVPYLLWNELEPPQFLGVSFHPEDEFGVFGLHVWVWRHNPEGMFAESNPTVTC